MVETVLRFKDSKEKTIRRGVLVLLPRLASFSPERFAAEYLGRSLGHLLSVLKHQPERCVCGGGGGMCVWPHLRPTARVLSVGLRCGHLPNFTGLISLA